MVTFCEKRREKSHLASHKHIGKYTQERIRRRVTCAEPDDVAASVADGVYAVLPTLLHQTSVTACLFSGLEWGICIFDVGRQGSPMDAAVCEH